MSADDVYSEFHAAVERQDPDELARWFGRVPTREQGLDVYTDLIDRPISSWMIFHAGWLAGIRSVRADGGAGQGGDAHEKPPGN